MHAEGRALPRRARPSREHCHLPGNFAVTGETAAVFLFSPRIHCAPMIQTRALPGRPQCRWQIRRMVAAVAVFLCIAVGPVRAATNDARFRSGMRCTGMGAGESTEDAGPRISPHLLRCSLRLRGGMPKASVHA